MKGDSRTTFLMVTALVLALAAMFAASPAGARPIDLNGTELTAADRTTSVRPDDQGDPLGVGAVSSSTPIWMKALQARSEALDRYYGLGQDNATSTYEKAMQARSEALDRYYGLGQDNATPTWMRALQLRSEELDRQYGLGKPPESETVNSGWYTGLEYADLQPIRSSSDDGFPWGNATFGIGAALLALLLAGTTVMATRSRHGRLATH